MLGDLTVAPYVNSDPIRRRNLYTDIHKGEMCRVQAKKIKKGIPMAFDLEFQASRMWGKQCVSQAA